MSEGYKKVQQLRLYDEGISIGSGDEALTFVGATPRRFWVVESEGVGALAKYLDLPGVGESPTAKILSEYLGAIVHSGTDELGIVRDVEAKIEAPELLHIRFRHIEAEDELIHWTYNGKFIVQWDIEDPKG